MTPNIQGGNVPLAPKLSAWDKLLAASQAKKTAPENRGETLPLALTETEDAFILSIPKVLDPKYLSTKEDTDVKGQKKQSFYVVTQVSTENVALTSYNVPLLGGIKTADFVAQLARTLTLNLSFRKDGVRLHNVRETPATIDAPIAEAAQ